MALGDGTLFGYNSSVGISEETTYGTKVDSFSYVEFNTESFKREIEEKKLESINATRDFIKRVLLNESVTGSLEVEWNPASDACVYVLKQAMGGTATISTISASIPAEIQHTFNLGDMESNKGTSTSSDVKSLSFQVSKGSKVWDFLGCRINTFTLKAEVGGMVMMTSDIIGQTASITSSTPVASFTDIIPCDFIGVTFATGDSITNVSAETIQSFELTINNNLAGDTRQLGSRSISKAPPLRREIMLKVAQRFDTVTAHNIFLEGTATAIQITLDSNQTMSSDTGSLNYNTVIKLPKCYYNSNMPEVGGPDVLNHEIEISALKDNTTTAYAMQVTVNNLTANYF